MKKQNLLLSFLMAFIGFGLMGQDTERLTDAHPSNFRSWGLGLHVVNTFTFGDLISFQPDKPAGVDGQGTFALGGDLTLTKWWNPTIGTRLVGGYYTTSGTGTLNLDLPRNAAVRGPAYFEGDMINGGLHIMVNLSNLVLKGKIKERKGALLFGVGAGFSNSKAELFSGYQDTTIGREIDEKLGETGTTDAFGNPQNPAERSNQVYFPLSLEYKFALSNLLDLDFGGRYLFTTQDWPDVVKQDGDNDHFLQAYVGLTFNFGDKEKRSIVFSNPLDKMYGDVQEVKENFDQLTTDDDGDGVNNFFDKDNSTPEGVSVDGSGRALDVDADGIPDAMDVDPFTAKGATVDADGRAVDSDGDGVPDYMDEEPNTPEGTMVNFMGRKISGGGAVSNAFIPSVYFGYNSATVTDANHVRLATIAKVMQANSGMTLELVGYADQRGSESYNKNLGMRRAEAVKKQLEQVYGIDAGRLSTRSEGESQPLAKGRYDINRRVDVVAK